MKNKIFLNSIGSLAITLAVLLSSVHAKDVVKRYDTSSVKNYVQASKYVSDEASAQKASTEHLHNHVDKQTLKVFKFSNSPIYQAERRSLTLLERDIFTLKDQVKIGWSLWLRLAAAKLML